LSAQAAQQPLSFRLLVTGESRGYLEPCGCAEFKEGGAARRATWIDARRREGPCLYVDNGDLVEGPGRQNQLKAETWAELLKGMRLDVLNLGEGEWALGIEVLSYLQQICGSPFLCANARTLDGQGIEPFAVVERAGKKIALIGVLGDGFLETARAANPQVEFVTVEKALAGLRPKIAADFPILLFHGPAAEAQAVLSRHRWIRLAVAAHEGDAPLPPRKVAGGALLVTAGRKSRSVLEVAVVAAGGKLTGGGARPRALPAELEESPEAAAILQGYLARVRAENLLAQVPKQPLPGQTSYAGADACRRCHAQQHRVWEGSSHARAFETLVASGHDADPECVGCHVVGLSFVSGYQDAGSSPRLKGVGCECCHGAGSQHAAAPTESKLTESLECCQACHVPDHSPRFNRESYWAKIKH
jgi:hypothetical protein